MITTNILISFGIGILVGSYIQHRFQKWKIKHRSNKYPPDYGVEMIDPNKEK